MKDKEQMWHFKLLYVIIHCNMFRGIFDNISEAEKNVAVEGIIQHATPRKDFFLMLTLSVSMAAFAILLNNTIILVGSMLIAPLLYPLLSLSLGIIVANEKLISRSLYTIVKSFIFAIIASIVIGLLFSNHNAESLDSFVLSIGVSQSLMYAVVAAIAGFAAAFAVTKPHLNETLPGVAISVSLVPPLATAGVALSLFNWSLFSSALLLFLVNIIGITFSAMIVFALLNLSVKKTVTTQTIQKEETVIKKEEDISSK